MHQLGLDCSDITMLTAKLSLTKSLPVVSPLTPPPHTHTSICDGDGGGEKEETKNITEQMSEAIC